MPSGLPRFAPPLAKWRRDYPTGTSRTRARNSTARPDRGSSQSHSFGSSSGVDSRQRQPTFRQRALPGRQPRGDPCGGHRASEGSTSKTPCVCVVVADERPDLFERAALRWLARYALERRDASLDGLRQAADAFARLDADRVPSDPPWFVAPVARARHRGRLSREGERRGLREWGPCSSSATR